MLTCCQRSLSRLATHSATADAATAAIHEAIVMATP